MKIKLTEFTLGQISMGFCSFAGICIRDDFFLAVLCIAIGILIIVFHKRFV